MHKSAFKDSSKGLGLLLQWNSISLSSWPTMDGFEWNYVQKYGKMFLWDHPCVSYFDVEHNYWKENLFRVGLLLMALVCE